MFVLHHRFNESDRKKKFILCAGLCLTAVLLAGHLSGQNRNPPTAPSQQRAQPLDPLTPEEIGLASRIASSNPKVKEALGTGRQLLVEVSFLALKSADYAEPTEPEKMRIGRHAAVIFYRYDQDLGIHVVVDLEQKSVGQITSLQGATVPLAYEEVVEAFNLAARNEQVRSLLGSRAAEFIVANPAMRERPPTRVEGLRIVGAGPEDRCFKHRCVSLLFRLPRGYIAGTSVTVDLTSQTVSVERKSR